MSLTYSDDNNDLFRTIKLIKFVYVYFVNKSIYMIDYTIEIYTDASNKQQRIKND